MVSRHQLRQAIEIIEEATFEGFSEITQELKTNITKLKIQLDETDRYHKLLSADIGKAQALYGFTEKFFKQNNTTHSFTVKKFVKDWMEKQSDWRFPILFLSPSQPSYTEYCLKSNLVYVCTNNFSKEDIISHIKLFLKKTDSSNPSMFRIKPLLHEGKINDDLIPQNQIGNIFSIDYFPYLSIQQIKDFFKSFSNCLRPGGTAMIHITDADCEPEWKSVVAKKITYCNVKIVKDLCEEVGLQYHNCYHVDSMYTFFHIGKEGSLSSIKKMPTRIKKIK